MSRRLLTLLGGLFALAACSAPQPAEARPSIGTIAANLRKGTVTAPPATGVAYDTSIGASVDTNGFVSTPLRAGAHQYHVANGGSDARSCATSESAATPLATVAAGMACVTNGNGDQVLLAEGSTFAESIPWLGVNTRNGFSAQYPTVIASYDPADPTNVAKIGMGHQRNARPILTGKQGQVTSGIGPRYLVIKGLHFNPGNVDGAGLGFVNVDNDPPNSTSYVLIENNVFDYTGVSFDLGPGTAYVGQHIVVRNNSMHGMWSSGGITGCLYTAGVNGATAEDNVFYHCGWNEAGTREAASSAGGPTIFQHSYYFQTTTTNVIARRNLSIEGGGDCGIARGDITVTESLFIDCPNAMGLGTGPAYNTDFGSSDGVNIRASYNVALGSDNVQSTHPLGWGLTTGNGLPGSTADHNLFIRNPNVGNGAATLFSNIASDTDGNGSVPPSYMTFDSNVAYLWAPAGSSNFTQTDGFAPQVHTVYSNNKWDDPASGTNTQSSAGIFPNPYTAATFYTAMGYADRTALVSYAIAHPESHIQRTGLDLLLAGYGITHSFTPVAPTLSDLALSSTTFVRGTASSGSLTGATLGSSIGATGPPSGLTINGAARTFAWDGSGTGAASGTFSLSETLAGATNTPHSTTISYTITAPSSVTWAAATDWTRSNGNLTINRGTTAGGFWALAFATTSKTSGTFVVTVDAPGSGLGPVYVGFATSAETLYPGNDNASNSVGWQSNGSVLSAGSAIGTAASFTTGDVLTLIKSGSTLTLKKNGTIVYGPTDLTGPLGADAPVLGVVFPAASNGNGTGTQLTADFSGW